MTLALLIGMIIGYIIGNLIPYNEHFNITRAQPKSLGLKSSRNESRLTLDKLNKQ